MKKILLLISLCFLLLAAVTDTDVKIKRMFDDFEARVRKHLKTKLITLPVEGRLVWGDDDTYFKEISDDVLRAYVNDTYIFEMTGSSITFNKSINYATAETRYYSITHADFIGKQDNYDYEIKDNYLLHNRTNLGALGYYAPVHLPHGAIITKVKFYYYTNDALCTISLEMRRNTFGSSAANQISEIVGVTTGGLQSTEDTTLFYTTVDNTLYSYWVQGIMNPNDAVGDCSINGVLITYTITEPLP